MSAADGVPGAGLPPAHTGDGPRTGHDRYGAGGHTARDGHPADGGHEGAAAGRARLARRQAELVAALVAGAAAPPGFDPGRLATARDALLRKRAGEVAAAWPMLAAGLGERWLPVFRDFAAGRPPAGALRDGWDLAQLLAGRGELPPAAAGELRARRRGWRRDGSGGLRRRRLPALVPRWLSGRVKGTGRRR